MGWLDFLFGDRNKGRDGTSPQKAIIVDGISAEYQWVRDHFDGYTNETHKFEQIDGKPYDVLIVCSPSGDKRTIYFDISRFYGH